MPRAGSILQATGYRLQDHRTGNGAKSGTGAVVGKRRTGLGGN